MCQPYSRTQTVVLSGMGSLQYVPALVVYPDCGPVCHVSSVCASPSRHMCWSKQLFSKLRTDSLEIALLVIVDRSGKPFWGQEQTNEQNFFLNNFCVVILKLFKKKFCFLKRNPAHLLTCIVTV